MTDRARHARGPHRARGRHRRRARARFLLWAFAVGLLAVLTLVLLCGPASASAVPVHGVRLAAPQDPNTELKAVIDRATKWLVGILATVATFFLTLGGVKYLSAGGDPSEVEQAKGSLKNAGIGYALAVLAPLLLRILQSILGVSS